MAVAVNVDNFVRAETARMFDGGMLKTGGINRFHHERLPVPLDAQTVIRMNRDTLYSSAMVNITEGATLTIPDSAGRYVSLMGVRGPLRQRCLPRGWFLRVDDGHVRVTLRRPGDENIPQP